MKYPLIIGNWKLNGNKKIIIHFLTILTKKLTNISSKCHIGIAPPVMYLDIAKHYLRHSTVKLCAQNTDINLSGAFTGDISAEMLKDLGTEYVLIGHSERRIYHQENFSHITKKFDISKKIGLVPILCIGENQQEHNSGLAQSVCINQIHSIIKTLGVKSLQDSIIAYEPIWSIGSGISAYPKNVQLIHKSIRNYIAKYDVSIAKNIYLQYGGSVNPNNIIQFISQKDIDGVLIGSSSLKIDDFLLIIQLIDQHIKYANP